MQTRGWPWRAKAVPKVWGIGLTRTGTTSLNEALCHLNFEAVHWPTTSALLFGQLKAATDESVAAVYRFLDAKHPDSRFILTERAEQDWLVSTEKHRKHNYLNVQRLLQQPDRSLTPHERARSTEIQFTQMTLYGTVVFDERKFLAGYHRHLDDVSRYFEDRPERLLRLRICEGEGWERLCPFLECERPRVPFPYEHRSRTQ